MTGSTFDKKWIIGLVLGFAVLVLLLILLFRKGDDKATNNGSDNASNDKKDLGDKRVDPPSPPSPSPPSPSPPSPPVVEDCFVPEKQKFNCMHLNPSNDNMRDQIRCLKWRGDLINGGTCEELRMTYDDPSSSDGPSCGNCCKEYKDLYDSSCGGKDPIIHDKNKDRNRYPCGQDCSDQQTVEKCYTDIMNSRICDFNSPNDSDFLQACSSFANSNDLICYTEAQNACKNVVTNGSARSLCKNKK
jgi:hypothetical protein